MSFVLIFIATLLSFTYTEKSIEQSEKLENFLEIPNGNLKYNHIMSFLSDQVFGTFLTTLALVYGRKIFALTESSVISAFFTFVIFIFTISIITLSLGKISIQIFRSQLSHIKQWLIVIILLAVSYWFCIAGLELAPKISPSVQQSFLSK
ncbi:hypothetical protein AB6B30_10840 [Acinetobacter baumannii]